MVFNMREMQIKTTLRSHLTTMREWPLSGQSDKHVYTVSGSVECQLQCPSGPVWRTAPKAEPELWQDPAVLLTDMYPKASGCCSRGICTSLLSNCPSTDEDVRNRRRKGCSEESAGKSIDRFCRGPNPVPSTRSSS